jgi:ankyrin repeat protein
VYRVAPPTRLLLFGGFALALVFGTALGLSFMKSVGPRYAIAAKYAWTAGGVLTLLLAVAVRRRLAARASEYIQIDDAAITSVGPAGFRSLPWASVARLRVKRRGALEVSDANRLNRITVTRRFENFTALVHDVLRHLETAYADRPSGARSRPSTEPSTFASSVVPEVLQAIGGLAFTAASVFWSRSGFVIGLITMPVTMRRLGRVPYAITIGPSVKLATLAGTREIPLARVTSVDLTADHRGRAAVVIEDTSGEDIVIVISRLTERPLELYDRLRRLHEAQPPAPAVIPDLPPMRLVPLRAAVFIAACAVAGLGVAYMPIASGGVLRFAAERGSLPLARGALLLGSPVDLRANTQTTPLYLAARAGHLPIVTLLLGRGADPATRNRDMEFTPLHVAGEYGHVEIVRVLLDAGVPPDVRNKWEQTPLWQAAWHPGPANVEVATLLADRGASLDAADRDGFTPLHQTVRHGNIPLLIYLLERGARLDVRTKKGSTPASDAVFHGCAECIRLLGQAGVEFNVRDEQGRMLLVRAVNLGDARMIVALMTAGARADVAGDDGYNALQLAVWNGDPRLIALLIQRGADVNAASETVGPPLYLAVQRGHGEVIRVLLDKGARPDIPFGGYTALQRAAWQGETGMVQAMLDSGANPDAGSASQPPPMVLAAERGRLDVVTLFVDRGADVNVSHEGWTPLGAAQLRGHAAIVQYLREHGAR